MRLAFSLLSPPLSSAVSESKETSLILSHCSQYSRLNLNHKADYFKNKAAVMLNKGNEELTFIPPARLSELNLMRSDGNDANECVIWIHELTTVCKNSTVDM